jgi:two-component system, CitB family, response regulator DctR
MLHQGAVDYIMKPFKFERVREALENYRMMKRGLGKESTLSQVELDQLLHGNGGEPIPESPNVSMQMDLPKGLQALTMKQVMLFLMQQHKSLSAEEVAEGVGLARVTARRYLDFLEKNKHVKLDLEYGGIGRPINRYVWTAENKRS